MGYDLGRKKEGKAMSDDDFNDDGFNIENFDLNNIEMKDVEKIYRKKVRFLERLGYATVIAKKYEGFLLLYEDANIVECAKVKARVQKRNFEDVLSELKSSPHWIESEGDVYVKEWFNNLPALSVCAQS